MAEPELWAAARRARQAQGRICLHNWGACEQLRVGKTSPPSSDRSCASPSVPTSPLFPTSLHSRGWKLGEAFGRSLFLDKLAFCCISGVPFHRLMLKVISVARSVFLCSKVVVLLFL